MSGGSIRSTVEDVRASAGSRARGSFYNYFLTYEHMLKELAGQISLQINKEQTARFDDIANLIERMWCNPSVFHSSRRLGPLVR